MLFDPKGSRAWRSHWMLRELGLDEVEMVDVPIDIKTGATFKDDPAKAAEFEKLNPNKRMPTLVDKTNGINVFESSAINLYLAKRTGGARAPADLQEDALMTQWAIWVHCYVENDVINMFFGDMRKNPEQRSEIVSGCMTSLDRPMKALNKALEGKQFLVGDRFTAADLSVAANILFGGSTVPDFTGFIDSDLPNVSTWLKRCQERPSYVPMGGLPK